MKPIKIVFLLIICSLMSFTAMHKYYVSVTQIEYVKDKQSVQIISRLFIDDLESLIRKRYDESITLATENESKQVDYYVAKYLKEKIQIKINNQETKINFIGKEYEADIVYCYLEIEKVASIKSFEIKNQVFYDLFDEQQNIVRININEKNKSFLLIKENDKGLLNF